VENGNVQWWNGHERGYKTDKPRWLISHFQHNRLTRIAVLLLSEIGVAKSFHSFGGASDNTRKKINRN
jgi:hypothetical protein